MCIDWIQESKSRQISLPELPILIEHLLEYLYEHDYSELYIHKRVPGSSDNDKSAAPDFGSVDEEGKSKQFPELKDDTLNSCWLHSSMYHLGDKYLISSLKSCSLLKFKAACDKDSKNALSSAVIDVVYGETSSEKSPLQESLVRSICTKAAKLDLEKELFDACEASHFSARDMAIELLREKRNGMQGRYISYCKCCYEDTTLLYLILISITGLTGDKILATTQETRSPVRFSAYCSECTKTFVDKMALFQHDIDFHCWCSRCCQSFRNRQRAKAHAASQH